MIYKQLFLLVGTFLLMSCSSIERDNPNDPNSNKYRGWQVVEPPVAEFSSGSVKPSSSSVAQWMPSSSSLVMPSSSSAIVSSSSSSIQTGVILGEPVDYEDETYQTVVIGTQTWFKRNLNYNADGSFCYGDDTGGDSQNNCSTYGRLYDWATAMELPSNCNINSCSSQINAKHKGICPEGWHIPSDADWTTLTNYVGSSTAGKKLKASSGWNDYKGKSGNGEDTYGFAALPGGDGNSSGAFNFVGILGYWWSATEDNANIAYSRHMGYTDEYVGWYDGNKSNSFFSVRCLQD